MSFYLRCRGNKYFIGFFRFLYVLILWSATSYLVSIFFGATTGVGAATFVFCFIYLYYEKEAAQDLLRVTKQENFVHSLGEKFWRTVIFLGVILFITALITVFVVDFLEGNII